MVLNKKGPEEVVVGSDQGENRPEMCLETKGSRTDNTGEKRKQKGRNMSAESVRDSGLWLKNSGWCGVELWSRSKGD